MLSRYPTFTVPAHRLLARRGEPVGECFLVKSGAVERREASGRSLRSGPGELLAAEALTTGAPGAADLLTVTEVEVVVLDRPALQDALSRSANLRALVSEPAHVGVAA